MSQKIKNIFLLLVFLCFGMTVFSQKKLFIEDELPTDMIYQIVQDTSGFIWLATDKGIVKYDGSNVRVFTIKDGLPANDIWEINVTDNNKIWYFCKNKKIGYIENDTVYAFAHENPEIGFRNPNYIKDGEKLLIFDEQNNLCDLKNYKLNLM